MSKLLLLCFEFFKTGLFSVGGGLATIPFLKEIALKYGWFSLDSLTTMIAVSESTPGPMGVNMATYVGYAVGGIAGAVIATLSLVAPSIIVICIIAGIIDKFRNNKIVNMVFYGLRAATVALIISASLSIFEITLMPNSFRNLINIALFVIIYYAYKKFKIHPILVIVGSAIIGILIGFTL